MGLTDKQQDEVYEWLRRLAIAVIPFYQEARWPGGKGADPRFKVQTFVDERLNYHLPRVLSALTTGRGNALVNPNSERYAFLFEPDAVTLKTLATALSESPAPKPQPEPVPDDFAIIRQPSAPEATVLGNLPASTHDRFRLEMVPELWATAVGYGVDPVGVVAQSGKETGWGRFEGRVPSWFYNTAGMKVRHVDRVTALLDTTDPDHPLVHQQFPNWRAGATAHVQHLRAYAGKPVAGLIVDPRYTLVGPPAVTTWAQLGGRWAPSPAYGTEIEAIIRRLRGLP